MRTKKTKSKTSTIEPEVETREAFSTRAGNSEVASPITEYVSIASLPETPINNTTAPQLRKSKIEVELVPSNDVNSKKYSSVSMLMPTFAKALHAGGLDEVLTENYGLQNGNNISNLISYYNNLQNYLKHSGNTWYIVGQHDYDKPKFGSANGPYFITTNDLDDRLNTGKNYVSINNSISFNTRYNTLESTRIYLDIDNKIEEAPATDSDKHNRYIFKIFQHTSNTYTCRTSGWFMCYGWTSEKETYIPKSASGEGTGRQDNCKRWAALEGKFTKDGKEYWKILQVQPVLPGNGCNYISFSLPVRKDLVLRVVTGFDVGNNSGKFSNVPGSLANHIANAFVGGIYV